MVKLSSSLLLLFGLYEAIFQEVGYAFYVVQGKLSDFGFQWFISGYGYEVADFTKKWAGCLAVNLQLGCVALLKTFGENDVIILTDDTGYHV